MKSLLGASLVAAALAQPMKEMTGVMRVANMAPEGGTCQTPVWVGIHNGTFDIYNLGEQASASLESLAEEGVVLPLVREFDRTPGGVWDGVIGNGPICPGDAVKAKFTLSFTPGETLYVSYASMVIPSNDAFVANGNPMEHMLIGADGMPAYGDEEMMLKIRVRGNEVLDAGTELNDEVPENTAFFGQTMPNSGVSAIPFGGVVAPHPGFKAQGEGGILDSGNFANANFTADHYKMMRLVVFFPEGGVSPDDDEDDASPDDDEEEEPDDDEEEEPDDDEGEESPDDDEEEEPDDDEDEESPDDDEEEEESPDDDEPEVSVDDSPDDETAPPRIPVDGGLRRRNL